MHYATFLEGHEFYQSKTIIQEQLTIGHVGYIYWLENVHVRKTNTLP